MLVHKHPVSYGRLKNDMVHNSKMGEEIITEVHETVNEELQNTEKELTPSPYFLRNQSQLSRDVDRWMGIDTPNASVIRQVTVTGGQGCRGLRGSQALFASVLGYILAGVMPILRNLNGQYLGCSSDPRRVYQTTQMQMIWLAVALNRLWEYLRSLAQERILREIFATVMDFILLIYVIGFVVLSMYQASIFS